MTPTGGDGATLDEAGGGDARARGTSVGSRALLAVASLACSRALASSRAASEDRIVVIERGDTLVVAVADGAGGMRGGAAASDALVRAVERFVAEEPVDDLHDAPRWHAVFAELDARLAAAMSGETTAIVLVLSARGVTGTSVGDSEAWLVASSGIDDLTASQDRKRLGSGRAMPVSFARPSLTSTLLAATDGLFKYAIPAAIANAARTNATDALLALVRLPSGRYPDDVALALITLT